MPNSNIKMRFIYFLLITVICIISNISIAQNNADCIVFQSIYEYRNNDTLNDYYFEINEKGINKLFENHPNELAEYELLPDKKDYYSIFSIIEQIDNNNKERKEKMNRDE